MKKIILSLILLTALNSCGYLLIRPVIQHNIKKNRATSIPPDFGKDSSQVLVIRLLGNDGGKYDKIIQKKAPKLFGGKIEFMTDEQINNLDSSNVLKYRYSFNTQNAQYHDAIYTSGPKQGMNTTTAGSRKFWIIDRVTGKKYSSKISSGMYKRVIESYLVNLEKVRLEHINPK